MSGSAEEEDGDYLCKYLSTQPPVSLMSDAIPNSWKQKLVALGAYCSYWQLVSSTHESFQILFWYRLMSFSLLTVVLSWRSSISGKGNWKHLCLIWARIQAHSTIKHVQTFHIMAVADRWCLVCKVWNLLVLAIILNTNFYENSVLNIGIYVMFSFSTSSFL